MTLKLLMLLLNDTLYVIRGLLNVKGAAFQLYSGDESSSTIQKSVWK